MRCSEVRRRLSELNREGSTSMEDPELREHLESCAACAAEARAAADLQQALADYGRAEEDESLSFASLRSRVESDLANQSTKPAKDNSIMKSFANFTRRRSRLSLGLALTVVILLAATLIPIKFERTVGYEVAVAGVDKDLAMDQYKIQLLLDKLGVEGASINVDDCEVTCRLTIKQLKSEEQVELVLAAFDKVNNVVLDTVIQLSEADHHSLLAHVDNVFFGDQIHQINLGAGEHDQITLELVNKLHSDSEQYFNIWTPKDPAVQIVYETAADENSPARAMFIGKPEGDDQELQIGLDPESNGTFSVTTPDGNVHRIDLNSPDALEQLRALGLNVTDVNMDEVSFGSSSEKVVEEAASDAAAKTADDGVLPKEFELSQNYPNPFNPTTTIDFVLPQGGRVLLQVFDIQGRLVKTLLDKTLTAGRHSVDWNSTSESGARVASGVYLYKLTAEEFSETKKMTLIK